MSTIHRILALRRGFVGSEARKAQLIIRITGRAFEKVRFLIPISRNSDKFGIVPVNLYF